MKVESTVYNGQLYHRAPSSTAFASAISLHAAFIDMLDQAYAVYVIGGDRSNPVTGARVQPLDLATVPNSVTVRGNSYAVAQDLLGAAASVNYTGNGFTVITVANAAGTVSGVAQVRRDDSGGNRYYRCELRTPSGGSWGYYFYTPAGEHHGEDLIASATAFWYRWDPFLRRYEEGPRRVIFPDPLIPTSNNTEYALVGSTTTAAFSRFAYFVDEY
jgi:hypothetical protein